MFNFLRVSLLCLSLFSTSVFAAFVQPDKFTSSIIAVTGDFDSLSVAHSASISEWKSRNRSQASCATFSTPSYNSSNGRWYSAVGGCAGGGISYSAYCLGSYFNITKGMCEVAECPAGTEPNANDECVPASNQCEAGQSSSFEFLYCYNYDGGNGCSAGTSTGRPGSFCRNSCVHIPDYNPSTTDADCYAYQNGDGSSGPAVFCSVTAETNGSECSGEYTPDTPDNSCPAGTVPGQLNGKNVCIPSGDGGGDGGDNGGGDNGGGDGGDNGGGDGGDDGGGDGGDNGGGDGGGDGGDGGGNGNGNGGGDGDGSGNGDGTGGSGTGGEGDGDGDGSGGSGEGVDNCESGRCDFGDERGDPFGGEVRSFADSLTAAMNGMKNSPLGNSIGNIQFPTGGSCPTGSTSINIGIGSIPIDFTEHCNFWQQIAPILSAVFLALWAIIAVRVFLSA